MFGGGMRQTGFMAGSAAYALTHNFPRLPAVHDLTRRLEAGLVELGVEITSPAETCMVCLSERGESAATKTLVAGILRPIADRRELRRARGAGKPVA